MKSVLFLAGCPGPDNTTIHFPRTFPPGQGKPRRRVAERVVSKMTRTADDPEEREL